MQTDEKELEYYRKKRTVKRLIKVAEKEKVHATTNWKTPAASSQLYFCFIFSRAWKKLPQRNFLRVSYCVYHLCQQTPNAYNKRVLQHSCDYFFSDRPGIA